MMTIGLLLGVGATAIFAFAALCAVEERREKRACYTVITPRRVARTINSYDIAREAARRTKDCGCTWLKPCPPCARKLARENRGQTKGDGRDGMRIWVKKIGSWELGKSCRTFLRELR